MAVQIPPLLFNAKEKLKRVFDVGTGLRMKLAFVICMKEKLMVKVLNLLKKLLPCGVRLLLMLVLGASGKLSLLMGSVGSMEGEGCLNFKSRFTNALCSATRSIGVLICFSTMLYFYLNHLLFFRHKL